MLFLIPILLEAGSLAFSAYRVYRAARAIQAGVRVASAVNKGRKVVNSNEKIKNAVSTAKVLRNKPSKTVCKDCAKTKKIEQLKKNAKEGKEFSDRATRNMKKTTREVRNEITIKTKSGVKSRADAMGFDKKTGKLRIQEHKKSPTASLTKSQKKAIPEIAKSGATVVGKGKPPFTGGFKIEPTKIEIIRGKK